MNHTSVSLLQISEDGEEMIDGGGDGDPFVIKPRVIKFINEVDHDYNPGQDGGIPQEEEICSL